MVVHLQRGGCCPDAASLQIFQVRATVEKGKVPMGGLLSCCAWGLFMYSSSERRLVGGNLSAAGHWQGNCD